MESQKNSQSILTTQGLTSFCNILKQRSVNKTKPHQIKLQMRKYQEQLKLISTTQSEYLVNHIIPELMNIFLNTGSYKAYLLILSLLQNKYTSSSSGCSINHIPIPKATEQAVIALSYQQNIWSTQINPQRHNPLVVVHENDIQNSMKDQYGKQDELLLNAYLENNFQTVKRQDVKELFYTIATVITQKITQKFITSDPQNLQSFIESSKLQFWWMLIQLIQSICPCIYTYHLIKIIEKISLYLIQVYSTITPQNFNIEFKKQNHQESIYRMLNISERWRNTNITNFDIKRWEWNLKSIVICRLIGSLVSQQKLYGVKLLCQVCRRTGIDNNGISYEEVIKYLCYNSILQKIYSPSNHPSVIMKGKQILQFICKYNQITQQELSLVLNLLDKSHVQVCKSLYDSIQAIGETNLRHHRIFILDHIMNLSRASFFCEQTLSLIESIILLTPLQQTEASLQKLYLIIDKHYSKFKKTIKERIINIYFEFFIIAVQEKVYEDKDGEIIVMKPMLKCLGTELAFVMIQSFVFLLLKQKNQKIEQTCNKILIKTIKTLFNPYQIHKIHLQGNHNRQAQLKLINHLVQTYCIHMVDQKMILTYQDICELIEEDISFCIFIQYYQEDKQFEVLKKLLYDYHIYQQTKHHKIDFYNSFMELYQLVAVEIQQRVQPEVKHLLKNSQQNQEKSILAKIYFHITQITLQQIIEDCFKNKDNNQQLWTYLILLKECINKSDNEGYGDYPPFKVYGQEYEVKINVINSLDVLVPIQSSMIISNNKTIKQVVHKVLKLVKRDLIDLKMKLGDSFITLDDFQTKISDFSLNKSINLSIYESSGCEWFNKCQLINEKKLNSNVVTALREIFTKYAEHGRLRRKNCAKIFETVTETEKVEQTDIRISLMFNKHSQNNQYLTVNQWLDFYLQSSIMNPGVVVQNLKKFGYAKLFKQHNFMQFQSTWQNNCRKLLNQREISTFILDLSEVNMSQSVFKVCLDLLNLLPLNTNTVHIEEMLLKEQNCNNKVKLSWYLSKLMLCKDYKGICQNIYNKLIKLSLELMSHNKLEEYEKQIVKNMLMIERDKYSQIKSLLDTDINDLDTTKIKAIKISSPWKINFIQIQRLMNQISLEQIERLLVIYLINYQYMEKQIQLNRTLIFHQNIQVRRLFNNFYLLLSHKINTIKPSYYKMQCQQFCEEYFKVIVIFLMEEPDDQILQHYSQQIQSSLQSQIQRYDHQLNNPHKNQHRNNNNNIMLGRLKILNLIKIYSPQLVIPEQILKHVQKNCVTESSREVYYALSEKLCTIDYNMKQLENMLKNVHIYKNSIRRQTSYMGLYNLGCICYINATVQQLFMIQPFRKIVLEAEVIQHMIMQEEQEKTINRHEEQEVTKINRKINRDSYFEHFQYMFYELAYGQRLFFIPRKFCQNYVDFQNVGINIKQQHDADEFLNNLLDRIEHTLSPISTKSVQMIKQNLCGSIVNTIECQSCFNTKERIQNFYILSLEIKGINNLDECLAKLIEPEVICQYYCEHCEKKQQIHKCLTFNALPTYLFIHLQRLVFDLQSLTKIKLDHPVEFPLTIDLQPYFKVRNQQCIYQLRGFIVHAGGSQGGHYYSLIRDTIDGQVYWLKFDDSRVQAWNWNYGSGEKIGAYMLIYQNVECTNKLSKYQSIQVNTKIMQQIRQDNNKLANETLLFHECLPDFIQQTIKNIVIPSQLMEGSSPNNLFIPFNPNHTYADQILKNMLYRGSFIITQYINLVKEIKQSAIPFNLNKPNKSKSKKTVGQLLKHLTCYLILFVHLLPEKAEDIMHEMLHNQEVIGVILTHTEPILRQLYKLIVIKLLSILTSHRLPLLQYSLFQAPIKTLIKKTLLKITSEFDTIHQHISKSDDYFQMIYCICEMSCECRQWLIMNNMVARLVHLLMQNDSPLKKYYKAHSMLKKQDTWNVIISIIQKLVSSQKYNQVRDQQINFLALGNIQFYLKMYKQRCSYIPLNKILCYYSLNNQSLTNSVIRHLLSSLNRFSHHDIYITCYLHLTQLFILIDDQLQHYRFQAILGIPIIQVTSEHQNIDKKWLTFKSFRQRQGDQFYLPFLQILYLNRKERSYFSLIGLVTLLKSILLSPSLYRYVLQLPSFTIHQLQECLMKDCLMTSVGYLSWVGIFLTYFLRGGEECPPAIEDKKINKKVVLEGIDQHKIINEIALLIGESQNLEQNIKDIQVFRGLVMSYKFPPFTRTGETERLKIHSLENYIQIEFKIVYKTEHQENTKQAPVYLWYIFNENRQIKVQFNQPNYKYSMILSEGTHQLLIPYVSNFQQYIKVSFIGNIQNNQNTNINIDTNQNNQHNQHNINNENNHVIKDQEWEQLNFPSLNSINNNPKQANPNNQNSYQIFQCPFCGSVSQTFSKKCEQCGQEWGEMY